VDLANVAGWAIALGRSLVDAARWRRLHLLGRLPRLSVEGLE
jgi:hypothetical protein